MNNDWLDIDVLEDYLDGKLDPKTMHFVEKQALEDPFVAEALEGLSQSPKRKHNLSILQKQLQERLELKPIKRKLWGINTQRLSIAATATVAFIVVSVLFILRETNRRNQEIAQHKKDGIIVNLDSVSAIASAPVDQTKKDSARQQAVMADALEQSKITGLAKNTKDIRDANSDKINNEVAADRVSALESSTESKVYAAPMAKRSAPIATGIALAPTAGAIVISGMVVEKESGNSLPGAYVKVEGTNIATVADSNGKYTLQLDSSQKGKNIQVGYVGYKTEQIAVSKAKLGANIALAQNENTLSEVVVVSAGTRAAKKEMAYSVEANSSKVLAGKVAGLQISNQPIPTENFEEYLAKNNRLTPNGLIGDKVILTFKVDNYGSPKNVKIVEGASNQQNQEAIRLVLEGPKWKKVKDDVDTVRLTVKF